MFGMGGSEIIVILVVALLFLGPDKLPGAAKSISKGIRDIKKQSRALQQQIEGDEQIGGAIRDLKSALRGEEAPLPRPKYQPKEIAAATDPDAHAADAGSDIAAGEVPALGEPTPVPTPLPSPIAVVTLPRSAGEAADVVDPGGDDDLAAMVKPAAGTVAKGS
ncbi:MAG TPA: twin-arginine translocase TatA/TatE family subunit [Kofleriaceae bacterium]|nr:twin-arginine translocase TatA/TatE family subunit [Kofleriaceae bacterium]